MNLILHYFPELSSEQEFRFKQLELLYFNWNQKINVISRKDMDNFYERHVLHSLAITKFINLDNYNKIIDIGTGGGFPGIPLAILYPHIEFHLIDSIAKKITVVQAIQTALKLDNVITKQSRIESYTETKFDVAVTRAVAPAKDLILWTKERFNQSKTNIIALKGGNLSEELAEINLPYKVYDIQKEFKESFFETKKVLHLNRT